MAGIGFKIADGYVEVHARYDKGEVRRAAQEAADDNDKAFNKERERNSKSGDTRNTNRNIGRQAAGDFGDAFGKDDRHQKAGEEAGKRVGDGTRKGLVDNTIKSCTRDFHDALSRCVNKQANKQRGFGKKIGREVGIGLKASALGRGFIEAVTFGQADIGGGVASKLAPAFAKAGGIVGAIFAGLFIAEVAAAITAVTPILLGGLIAAIPLISLIKSGVKKEDGKWVFQANAMGKALKKLSGAWKEFKAVVSAPFQSPLIEILDHAGDSLRRLQGPWAALVKSISPGMVALFDGVFGAIEAFVKAVAPAMPGVVAGLQAWGRELPKIGKALGDFFSKIMADPERVRAAVQNISIVIRDVLKVLGFLIPILTTVGNAWLKWGNLIVVGAMIAQGGMAIIKKIGSFIREVFTKDIPAVLATLKQRWNEAVTGVKTFVSRIVTFLKGLPGKAGAAVSALWARVKVAFDRMVTSGKQRAREAVDGVVKFLKSLPGKAASALSSLASKVGGEVSDAATKAKAKAKDLVDKVVATLKGLPGKAKSAVSSLASKVGTEFSQAVTKGKQKAKELVDGFIKKLNELPGKAKSAAGKVKGAVQSALSGAGSWLVGAGKALMNGLANGIRAGLTWVKNAAITAAKAAVGAAKRALGIKSPSTVAAEQIGKPLAEGIGVGMRRHVSEEFKELPGMLPKPASGKAGGAGNTYHSTSSWNPTINVHVAAGLDPVNAAARRALTKDIFLALEQYRKDYVDR